ncbi:hypothetical protein GN244_ATG15390 [Phytophthora infestans]|uniref:Stc1 domain-containing protein n=1 Tax=Phytophthora infestans TaxID=4787 RepID=A0A833SVB2_PHYIN|nr:hypothetical protein GN244_ATG15390 [Phytophthora infestans]
MVGPTCKQCEAKIDPLLQNRQRSTTDARARCVCCKKLQYGYPFRTISGRGSVRHCIACKNGPKAVKFWEEKPPPPNSAEVRRQESLSNVEEVMGPDWYLKKKYRHSRPRKLTARNVRYTPSQADRPKRGVHRAKEAAVEQYIGYSASLGAD